MKKFHPMWLIGVGAMALTACQHPNEEDPTVPATPKVVDYKAPTDITAGVPVKQAEDKGQLQKLVALRAASFGIKQDPFALTPLEKEFDKAQSSERLFNSIGGWSLHYTPPVEEEQQLPVQEPQPYRRLSGVVVGDSVVAIIEEQTGPVIIRPGMKIPNTEWTVVSIDEDKAVLRRGGDVLPREISVRLETAPAGTTPAAGGFRGGPGGMPGGPGGFPGGFPGAPGGGGFPGRPGGGGAIGE